MNIDRYVAETASWIECGLESHAEPLLENCQSPIERGLALGFLGHSVFNKHIVFADLLNVPVRTDWRMTVHTQYPVSGFVLDFAVHIEAEVHKFSLSRWIGVECDGFQFHDANREAASRDKERDRKLVLAGFTMMRFTGSQIHQSVIVCAAEVIGAAEAIYRDWLRTVTVDAEV